MIALSDKVNSYCSENQETKHQNGHSGKSEIELGFVYMVPDLVYKLSKNMLKVNY